MWPVQRRWSLSSKTRPPPTALSSSNNNPSKDGGGRSAHRPKHHHNHPSSSSASAAVTEERRKIELIDLDFPITGRHNVKISIKENSPLSHVTDGLKKKYSTDGKATTSHHHHHHHHSKSHRIPEDATVELYQVDRLLTCSDEIPRRTSSLFYRVLPAGDDASALRITWRCPTLKLRRTQLETLAREAGAAGTSIGSLRESAAALLRAANPGKADLVQSAQQVVVEAAGGLRPGALQGNAWEARKVRTWLCRHLTLDLRPVGDFVVLRGVNEEYVWHRPYRNPRGYVDVPMLRQWLKNEVLAQVHARGIRRRGIDADDIRLSCRGKTVRKHSHVRPGETLDFEVPRAVEDGFVRAEAWLLPLSETCVACGDDKRVSEMPARRRVTAACEHDSGMCRECVGQWIRASLDTATWDRLRCPECPQLLSYEHVRAFAPRDVFDRYDALAVKAVLGGMEDFAWCLNPACESGQIYPPGCARAKCSACKHYLCVRHKVPWHSGETCEEYDRRTRRQRRNDQASEKHVKEITKPCPGCNRNINKYVGCDHVTCKFCPLFLFFFPFAWSSPLTHNLYGLFASRVTNETY